MRIGDWSSDVCSSDLITAVRDFGQFNLCPVNWVENVTGCGELRQRRLKHGKAEDVDLRVQVSICRCKWRSKCCRLRIDTIEVRAGAIAVEKLKLLGIGQTIAQPSVDIGLEHRNIVKNLARCQNPVRDGGDGRRLDVELDFRLWLCRASGFRVSCR